MESNERQLRIVDDMLNVARADSGRMHLQPTETDLGGMVADVIEEQKATINERQQTIIYKPPVEPVVAVVDGPKLRMVIENLLSNASKYTPEAGSITIKVKKLVDKACLEVADTGVGISNADINSKLFNKFARIDNPLSAKVGGTGLGLYLAKQIVNLHKGKLIVNSELGKGTTFVVELPVTKKGKP